MALADKLTGVELAGALDGAEDMMLEDGTNGAIVSFISKDDSPFGLVDKTDCGAESSDGPYYYSRIRT